MPEIKIKCTSGLSLPLDELSWYPSKLKKHSDLEIERLVDSISNDGFLFPLAVAKVDGKNYIIDGECRYNALQELKYRGFEIPEIPVFYVKSSKESIIKNMLISTSINHCVTEVSLRNFIKDTDIDLKDFAFSSPELIDFYKPLDLDLYVEKDNKEFTDLIKDDAIGLFQ